MDFNFGKSRDPKTTRIVPLKVLVMTGSQGGYEYVPYTIVDLKYKVKNNPSLIVRTPRGTEDIIECYWIRHIIMDTDKIRENLKRVAELNKQVNSIREDIISLMSGAEEVDRTELYKQEIKE